MKNIILLGAPRSGKSTFSKMILKEFPQYHLIKADTIFDAYLHTIIKLNNNSNNAINLEFSEIFTKELYDWSIIHNPDLNYILDFKDLKIEDALKYNKNNTLVLIFGYPNITLENKLKEIKQYENPDDWTYIFPNIVQETIEEGIKTSKKYKNICEKTNLKFIDTSKNREKILNELITWIKKHIN